METENPALAHGESEKPDHAAKLINSECATSNGKVQREERPNRRDSWSRNFQCRRGARYHMSYSCNDTGEVREIFLSAGKPNSEIQQHADTAAILCSLLLQYGVPASTIIHAVEGSPIAMALELAVQP